MTPPWMGRPAGEGPDQPQWGLSCSGSRSRQSRPPDGRYPQPQMPQGQEASSACHRGQQHDDE
eukprot:3623486-Pyramimonas_sp.AAC.1